MNKINQHFIFPFYSKQEPNYKDKNINPLQIDPFIVTGSNAASY